jgi:hypothetical protein
MAGAPTPADRAVGKALLFPWLYSRPAPCPFCAERGGLHHETCIRAPRK